MTGAIDSRRVAVLVLNWHGADDTIGCLRSLADLDASPGVIRVIDNGSEDDSASRIRAAFPDLDVTVHDDNRGFGAGHNPVLAELLGADPESACDWIWLVNNDARVAPDTLNRMLELAARTPSAGVIGAAIHHLDPPHALQALGGGHIDWWRGRSFEIADPKSSASLDYITGACMLLSADALRAVGTFDPRYFMYWEDADLCRRIVHAGWTLEVARNARVLHRRSSSIGEASPRKDFLMNASGLRFFRRHGPLGGWPAIFVGVTGRLARRLIRGQWKEAAAVHAGVRAGLKKDQ